jgi:hypothetical protein
MSDREIINGLQTIEFEDTMINEKFRDKIIERIKKNDGYCPCVSERNENTVCPCDEYLRCHECHCSLYIHRPAKIKVYIGKELEEYYPFTTKNIQHPVVLLREFKKFIDTDKNDTDYKIFTNNKIVIDFLYMYPRIKNKRIDFYLNNLLVKFNDFQKINDYLDHYREVDVINELAHYDNFLTQYESALNEFNEKLAEAKKENKDVSSFDNSNIVEEYENMKIKYNIFIRKLTEEQLKEYNISEK